MSTVVKTQVPRLNTTLESKLQSFSSSVRLVRLFNFLISNTKIIKTASLVGFYDN